MLVNSLQSIGPRGLGTVQFLFVMVVHFQKPCYAQTAWPQADQDACVQQCMTTGVNCSSGCGKPEKCATGWSGQIVERRCYSILPTMGYNTWSQAQSGCQANGSELASVHSEVENSFLVDLVGNQSIPDGNNHSFWLGMQFTRNASGSVTGASWSDSSAVDYGDPVAKPGVYPWATGEPTNAGNCVRMMGFGPNRGLWYAANCNQIASQQMPSIGYICKQCPLGWTTWNGHCYRDFISATLPQEQGTFVNFQLLCSMFNSNIVSIHSEAENNFVFGLAEAADPYFFFFMIGLQLRRDSKDYVNGMSWSDGSPVDFGGNISGGAGGVFPWADSRAGINWKNQPDNPAKGTVVRVSVRGSAEPGRWDDIWLLTPVQGTVCRL